MISSKNGVQDVDYNQVLFSIAGHRSSVDPRFARELAEEIDFPKKISKRIF